MCWSWRSLPSSRAHHFSLCMVSCEQRWDSTTHQASQDVGLSPSEVPSPRSNEPKSTISTTTQRHSNITRSTSSEYKDQPCTTEHQPLHIWKNTGPRIYGRTTTLAYTKEGIVCHGSYRSFHNNQLQNIEKKYNKMIRWSHGIWWGIVVIWHGL